MEGKFHLDDLKNPLYEHSQVITLSELMLIYKGLAVQHRETKWWQFRLRYGLAVSGHVIYEMISWLRGGKPTLHDPRGVQ